MRLDLLLDVVKAIETVPEEQFKMDVWWSVCGTTGCAIGHYCNQNKDIALRIKDDTVYLHKNEGGYLCSGIAIMEYFEITWHQAGDLFFVGPTTSKNNTKSQVIGRILKFVEDNSPVIQQEHYVESLKEKETVTI